MINKTTDEMRTKIRRNTVITMPDRPSERGIRAQDIKDALSKPICGNQNSVLAELDRVVDEANQILEPLTENVTKINEEYENTYILDTTTTPSSIQYEIGKDKTYKMKGGSFTRVEIPPMVHGDRAGLNLIIDTPHTMAIYNRSNYYLNVRREQGLYLRLPHNDSSEISIYYASNITAVKLQTLVYCDGDDCTMLISRVGIVTTR